MVLSRPLVATFVVVVLLAAAQPGPASSGQQSESAEAPEMIELQIGTGTVLVSQQVLDDAGDRFLTFVEPPVFTRTEEARQNPDLQPGDGGDEGLVTTDRRHTDYSYLEKPWTGGMRIENVHGTPTEYLCVCDVELRLLNESGYSPFPILAAWDSSHIWFDNITMYGSFIDLFNTHKTITSNSQFIEGNGLRPVNSHDGYIHNITAIRQRGPGDIFHHPPDPLELDILCFPNNAQPCQTSNGVNIGAGTNWTVEWSHFHQASAGSTATDTIIRHNTFRQGTPFAASGNNDISWNLIRDYGNLGTAAGSSDSLEFNNNSILAPFKISEFGIYSHPGLNVINCGNCKLANNDFIGYGLKKHLFGNQDHHPALLAQGESHIVADGNYWGTIHDPQIPPGVWIDLRQQSELILDHWETEPIHDITPIMWTLDRDDPPVWADQLVDIVVEEATSAVPDL